MEVIEMWMGNLNTVEIGSVEGRIFTVQRFFDRDGNEIPQISNRKSWIQGSLSDTQKFLEKLGYHKKEASK